MASAGFVSSQRWKKMIFPSCFLIWHEISKSRRNPLAYLLTSISLHQFSGTEIHTGGERVKLDPPSKFSPKLVNKNSMEPKKVYPPPRNSAITSWTLPLEFHLPAERWKWWSSNLSQICAPTCETLFSSKSKFTKVRHQTSSLLSFYKSFI